MGMFSNFDCPTGKVSWNISSFPDRSTDGEKSFKQLEFH